MKWAVCSGAGVIGCLLPVAPASSLHAQGSDARRPIVVADAVEMTRVRAMGSDRIAAFAHDGRRFAVVLRRGHLRTGDNEFMLVVYTRDPADRRISADTLARRRTRTNDEAIRSPRWLPGDSRLAFLGTTDSAPSQVYVADLRTHRVTRATNEPDDVVAYDMDLAGDLLYAVRHGAERSRAGHDSAGVATLVTTNPLVSLIERYPEIDPSDYATSNPPRIDVRLARRTGRPATLYSFTSPNAWEQPPLRIAPVGGRAVLCLSRTARDSASWATYKMNGEGACKLAVLDLQTGHTRTLLDTPSNAANGAVWAPDGKSVVVRTALPLQGTDSAERARRQTNQDIVELNIDTGSWTEVRAWRPGVFTELADAGDGATSAVVLWDVDISKGTRTDASIFRRVGDRWVRDQVIDDGFFQRLRPGTWHREMRQAAIHGDAIVTTVESGTQAPEVALIDWRQMRETVVTDLNPGFRALRFGALRDITWRDRAGREYAGALVLPPSYQGGTRYPLVIQTHGYDRGSFLIDGPAEMTSAFAAQPLANLDIMVLQLGGIVAGVDSVGYTNAASLAVAQIESAIDELDRQGLIDRTKVGLIGFSRTGWLTGYMATHSSYPLAAITTADNIDFSYWQYIENFSWARSDFEDALGGPPTGATFDTFRRNSVGFNLDRVSAPWRIETYGAAWSVVGTMETFAMLRVLGKPMEYVWIPDGVHQLVKPRQRAASLQGNVDWYRFWLKHEEDPDPAKAEQYARWRELRKQQEQAAAAGAGPAASRSAP